MFTTTIRHASSLMTLMLVLALALVVALPLAASAVGDKVRGDNGEGAVCQIVGPESNSVLPGTCGPEPAP
ncbi:MAG: hypothetical protein ACQERF_12525 [Actinomycetota bacterium]